MSKNTLRRALYAMALLWIASTSTGALAQPTTQPLPAQAQAGARDEQPAEIDRWYAVLIEGQNSGWSHMSLKREGDRYVTRSHMEMTMKRGDISVSIVQKDQFVETLAFEPVEVVSYLSLGTIFSKRQDIRFTSDAMIVETNEGGQKTQRTVALPKEKWLTPAQASVSMRRSLLAGEKEFSFMKIEPTVGLKPVKYTYSVQGRENVQVQGKVVPAVLLHSSSSVAMGLVMKEYVDDQGTSVKGSASVMPGMSMEIVLADEKIAKAQINPPELVASTLIKPLGVAVVEPRATRRGVYELVYQPAVKVDNAAGRASEVALSVPEVSVQRVEKTGLNTMRVTVDLDAKLSSVGGDVKADQPTEVDRSASSMINSDDPEILKLAAEVMKAASDGSDKARAEAARRFVHSYISKKSLSVGFASASETARTKQGDCTEHGVLLAAVLRAMKIPSRTVSGLVYAEEFLGEKGIFGYHLWTQAWVGQGTEGKWVDLDATLESATGFDATHIALSTSAMADGEMFMDMVSMASVVGRLSIRVVESK
jgi:hypothetical protein